jgi:hypothetical protein
MDATGCVSEPRSTRQCNTPAAVPRRRDCRSARNASNLWTTTTQAGRRASGNWLILIGRHQKSTNARGCFATFGRGRNGALPQAHLRRVWQNNPSRSTGIDPPLNVLAFLHYCYSVWEHDPALSGAGRDVSSAEVHGLLEPLARLPSPFEMPVARK